MMQKKKNIQKDMISHPKIAFFGTPEVASKTLKHMIDSGFTPSVVVTSMDKPVGRHFTVTPTPVKIIAEEYQIPVLTPEKIDDEFIEEFKKYECNISIVVAYGKIIPEKLINLPEFGTYNIHYSLLPRWRGATPVESAILADDKETGVTIQKMAYKLDSGDIVSVKKTPIREHENILDLRERLIHLGSELLIETIPNIISGNINKIPQEENDVTHGGKTKKEDADITNITDERKKWLMYRAYFGWPRVYFIKDGKRYIVTSARFENNIFVIERVIPEGKKETDYRNI